MDLFNGIQMLAVSKALDVAKSLLIVLDDRLRVKHLNQQAKKIFNWKNNKEILNQSLLNLCAQSQLPALLDRKGNLLSNEPITIHGHIVQWRQLKETTKSQSSSLLIGQDVTDKYKLRSHVRELIHEMSTQKSQEEAVYKDLGNIFREITGQDYDEHFSPQHYITRVRDFLENIIAKMPCYVYWKDDQFRYLGCNDMTALVFGLKSRKDIVGKTDYDLTRNKKKADSVRKIDEKIIATSQAKLNLEEVVFDYSDGKKITMLTNKMPLIDKNNRAIGMVGISVDITQRKVIEKKLNLDVKTLISDIDTEKIEQNKIYQALEKTSSSITGQNLDERLSAYQYVMQIKNYYESIIGKMPCYVFWKDHNFRYLGCNDISLQLLGLKSFEEVIGKTDYDFGWERWRADEIRKIDESIVKTGKSKLNIEETAVDKKGKKLYLLGNKMPLFNDKGEVIGVVGISVDVTERKFAQEALKKAEGKIDGMALVSASIAHELRTPLAGIKSALFGLGNFLPELIQGYQLAVDNQLINPEINLHQLEVLREMVSNIDKKVDHCNTVIDMLLTNLAQRQISSSDFKSCSIKECVNQALEKYTFTSGQRELIHVNIKEDFYFHGKEILIVHVLFNLLKNALYFVQKAGKGNIQIWTELDQDRKNYLHFKDTGQGIPPETLPHLFDQFFTKDTHHGAGIGLAFSKMVMETHQGDIICHSEYGQYAEFILSFPISHV